MYLCICECVCVHMYACSVYVCMYVCMYISIIRVCICMYVHVYVLCVCMYVCMYVGMYVCTDLSVTTKIPINTIGKVFRNRRGYLALSVPRPAGSGYRVFDPQSHILKANSLASHNHPQVLSLKSTFHTVQCSINKPPSKINKSTPRRQ
jgi:hypothetical protein